MSSSSEDSGNLASEVITYVGVPLAVVGVLPIFWTALITFKAVRRIKSRLKLNQIDEETKVQSDMFTRIIEVRYKRYIVTPRTPIDIEDEDKLPGRALDTKRIGMICDDSKETYIPGGTWSILKWNLQPLLQEYTQRVQHPEDLRRPQVEVIFEDLVAYLHDLGAVPDDSGWRILRFGGVWTAPGTPLMNWPKKPAKPLLITNSFENSDSKVSLALTHHWEEEWELPKRSALPPYSICLPPMQIRNAGDEKPDDEKFKRDIVCEITDSGLMRAFEMAERGASADAYGGQIATAHLRVKNGGSSDGLWFASLATACKMVDLAIGWKYTVPDDILDFSKSRTIPCGVLECLQMVSEQQVPSWRVEDQSEAQKGFQIFFQKQDELLKENSDLSLPHVLGEKATKDRLEREHLQFLDAARRENFRQDEARGILFHDALRSPKWDPDRVALNTLSWLKGKELLPSSVELKDAACSVLRSMVLDPKMSSSICEILDRWKSWAAQGGMRVEDLTALQEMPEAFACATLVTAMISKLKSRGSEVLIDLDECVKSWKVARLG